MDDVRFTVQDVREAERSRLDYIATTIPQPQPPANTDPSVLVIRQQFWLLRRDIRRRWSATTAGKALGRMLGRSSRQLPVRPPRPAVSIVIVAFNDGQCLQRAFHSVLAQTMPDWELVVWDAGSTDPATLDVLRRLSGYRIVKVRESLQVEDARRAAADRASGDVLVFLDPEDVLEPTYLEKAVLTFARYPGADVVCPAVRFEGHGGHGYWYPDHFTGSARAFRSPVPQCSAMHRRVWGAVGASVSISDGERFWKAVADEGFRGWPVYEALVRMRTPDNAIAHTGHGAPPNKPDPYTFGIPKEDLAGLKQVADRRVFHMPNTGKTPLVVFMAWMTLGGGAESFLLSALAKLRDEFDIVVISTNPVPADHESAANEFLRITPYVYDLPSLVGANALPEMVRSILFRLRQPRILLIGSLWAFANLRDIKLMSRGWGRIVDLEFNHRTHTGQVLEALPVLDEVLVAHRRLQSLFVDYYEVAKPVEVLYIAPPEHDVSQYEPLRRQRPGGRLRVGWLGRNSPEKRPDLVATIAAALPEVDFVIAGSKMRTLPPQPDNVEVVGWVDDALEFLAGVDFVLNTSDIEGVSVTAMEALRLGVPVLTRDVGGMAELVRDGDNGLIYQDDHIQGLADRLRDPGLVQRVRDIARTERLPPEFHFDTMIDTLRAALLGPISLYTESNDGGSPQP